MGVESGLTIPRLKALMAAYAARRRAEVAQLWQVIRHAQHSEDDNPAAVLPALPTDTVTGHDEDSDTFDAVEMVRRQRERERKREGG